MPLTFLIRKQLDRKLEYLNRDNLRIQQRKSLAAGFIHNSDMPNEKAEISWRSFKTTRHHEYNIHLSWQIPVESLLSRLHDKEFNFRSQKGKIV